MAEERKAASVDARGKDSLPDNDIGTGFLSSWKSMSLTEALDFSFDTGPKGKESFNFGKLDMNFNLDSDFSKPSSFKVDMPELDFWSPPKKTARPKEKSEDESSGHFRKKMDVFPFSFDLNGLDGLGFDSCPVKRGKSFSETFKDDQGACDNNKAQSSMIPETKNTLTSMIWKPEALQTLGNSKLETPEEIPGVCDAKNVSLESLDRVNHVTEVQERQSLTMKNMTSPSRSCQISQDLTRPSVSKNASDDDAAANIFNKVGSGAEKSVANVNTTSMGSLNESMEQTPPFPVVSTAQEEGNRERKEAGIDAPINIVEKIQSAETGLDLKNTSTEVVPETREQDTSTSHDVQNSTANIPSVETGSKPSFSHNKGVDRKEVASVRSSYFKKIKQTGIQGHCPPAQSADLEAGSRSDGSCLVPEDDRSAADEQLGCDTSTHSEALHSVLPGTGTVLVGTKQKNLNPGYKWDGDGKAVENWIVGKSTLQGKQTEGKITVLRRESDAVSQTNFSTSEKINKALASAVESLPKSEKSYIEKFEYGKSPSDFCTTKALMTSEVMQGSSNSTCLKEVCSLRNLKLEMDPASSNSRVSLLVGGSEKKRSQPTSLKRKILEIDSKSNAENSSPKPPKRLSGLPCNNRFTSTEEKVYKQDDQAETKAKVIICSPPAALQASSKLNTTEMAEEIKTKRIPAAMLEATSGINTTGSETPSIVENDGNIQKAEMYTKELENISNMLKKKHEEAKEVLVRAIVNNNYLLMLDHPMYEEKILKLQKFAAKLMSKELPMPEARGDDQSHKI